MNYQDMYPSAMWLRKVSKVIVDIIAAVRQAMYRHDPMWMFLTPWAQITTGPGRILIVKSCTIANQFGVSARIGDATVCVCVLQLLAKNRLSSTNWLMKPDH
jgi:hypothetical protein